MSDLSWQEATLCETPEAARALRQQAWGALSLILAFYEPGQRHLDTEAWKHA